MKKLIMILVLSFVVLSIYVYNGVFENPYDFRTHDKSPYYLQMTDRWITSSSRNSMGAKEYDTCRDEVVKSAQKACYSPIDIIEGMYYRHDYTYGECVLRYLAEICQVNRVPVEE